MPKFRKKPVVIEARRLSGAANLDDVARWCGGKVVKIGVEDDRVAIDIETLEGVMRADYLDWIIKGVKGEFYPCKPDIFDATYEPAE